LKKLYVTQEKLNELLQLVESVAQCNKPLLTDFIQQMVCECEEEPTNPEVKEEEPEEIGLGQYLMIYDPEANSPKTPKRSKLSLLGEELFSRFSLKQKKQTEQKVQPVPSKEQELKELIVEKLYKTSPIEKDEVPAFLLENPKIKKTKIPLEDLALHFEK